MTNFILGSFDFIGLVLAPLVYLLMKIASLFTYLGAIILNASIYYTVIEMAQSFSDVPVINTAWTVIRDLANMTFIFILLYAAIMTIVGHKDMRGVVVRMVVVAILINFSLFFTKVVIDISNLLALTFYNAIAPTASIGPENFTNAGLSNAIYEPLRVQSLMDISGEISGANIVTIGVMSSLVFLISAFIFGAVAIMFVIRYVALIFVMILSPFMFVSYILPKFKSYTEMWWSALIGQAFFAPIYFLLMWVTIHVINGVSRATFAAEGNFADALTGAAGAVPVLINFIVIIVFLVASLLIAKQVSNSAGNGMKGLNQWALGKAGGATFGVAGRISRNTLGRYGQSVADNEGLKDKASKGGIAGRMARLQLAAGRKMGTASYDVRGAKAAGALDAGKAPTGGFAKDMKTKIDNEKKFAESLKPTDLVVNKAERALDEARKSGNAAEILAAQAEVDRLKGVNEKEAERREKDTLKTDPIVKSKEDLNKMEGEIKKKEQEAAETKIPELKAEREKEVAAMKENFEKTKKASEERREEIKEMFRDKDGKLKTSQSLGNQRQETYAQKLEEAAINIPESVPLVGGAKIPVSFDRIAFVGPVTKEARVGAIEIRKKLKEKKSSDKLIDVVKDLAKEDKDEAEAEEKPKEEKPTEERPEGGEKKA